MWYLKDWFCDLRNKIITDGSSLYRDRYVKRDGAWKIHYASYERVFEISKFTEEHHPPGSYYNLQFVGVEAGFAQHPYQRVRVAVGPVRPVTRTLNVPVSLSTTLH